MGGTITIHYYVSLVIPVNGKLGFVIILCILFVSSGMFIGFFILVCNNGALFFFFFIFQGGETI